MCSGGRDDGGVGAGRQMIGSMSVQISGYGAVNPFCESGRSAFRSGHLGARCRIGVAGELWP